MRELGTARRLLMEEIREKKSVANSGKCKRVHSGRVRVRTASDVLSDRDWDRMNGHIRIYQLGRHAAAVPCPAGGSAAALRQAPAGQARRNAPAGPAADRRRLWPALR